MKILAALAVLLAACGQQPAASQSASPASQSASPASQSTSPAAPAAPCRLAVIEGSPPGSGLVQPGFQTLPEGTFTPVTDTGHPYYDRPLNRWVPAGPPSLAADGGSYAYIGGDATTSQLHVVDVGSGSDSVLASGGPWQVAGWGPNAVYVDLVEHMQTLAYGDIAFGKGLWTIPLDRTKPSQLTSDSRIWSWAGGGFVYSGGAVNIAGGPNDIDRFDSKTSRVTTIFSHHMRSRVLAVDQTGAALILAEGTDEELWRIPAAGDETELWAGTAAGLRPEIPVAVDGSEIWLSSGMTWPETAWSIFHYSPTAGFKQVATFTDRPVQVAGGCA